MNGTKYPASFLLDGVTFTGATLAGTPNYLLLAMQAFENAK